MPRRVCLLSFLTLSSIALATPALARMRADIFLRKAETLRARGALALFSNDLKRLQFEAEAAGDELHAEHEAALAAGRPTDYCTGSKQYLGPRELIDGLRAIPPAELTHLDIKAAMHVILVRNRPCSH